MKLTSIRKFLINIKLYLNRSASYLSLVNLGMILFLFLSKLKDMGIINFPLEEYVIQIYCGGILLLIFLGWFEMKMIKGLSDEFKAVFELNPYMKEMRDNIREIKMEVKQ